MTLLQDLEYALRTLAKSPAFAAVAIATVALTIGANTAMFSFVDGTLLDPLPYPDAERIVRLDEITEGVGISNVSTLNYLDWVEQSTVFEQIAAQAPWGATLTGNGEPTRVRAARVSAELFEIRAAEPALGRTFTADEQQPGNDDVVLLSHGLWQNGFGGDPAIVGRVITVNGEPHVVVGVLPRAGSFDRGWAQLFKPLAFAPSEMTRDFHWFDVVAKLAPGVSLDQAQAQMNVIAERIAQAYPGADSGHGVIVRRLADTVVGTDLGNAVIVLFCATVLVLLIGCANLASLTLARGMSRAREMGVRASLGAGRWRLARQLLTENLVLSVCGGLLGILIGHAALEGIGLLLPPLSLPAEIDVGIDAPVMLFTLAVAVGTGVLFSLAPAFQASRTSLVGSLREGSHGSTASVPARRLRSTLVVAEITLAFVLLVGAGLLIRSFFSLLESDPGFDSSNVLTAGLPITHEADADGMSRYLDSIQAAVAAVPGVSEVAVTSGLPTQGASYGMPYQVAGRELADRGARPWALLKIVSPSYFGALRIRFLGGRGLGDDDAADAPRVMVINETLARQTFGGEDPLGRRMLVEQVVAGEPALGPEVPWEIVGVIEDENVSGLGNENRPTMYVPVAQSPDPVMHLIVRSDVDPRTLQRPIRQAIDEINADQVLSDVRTLERIEAESLGSNRMQSTLLGLFGGIALLLAALGIYSTISYTVVQRTHEMGIRAALGADLSHIRTLILRGGMRLTLLGLAFGLLGSLAVSSFMGAVLHDVAAYDPLTLAVVTLLLASVAAGACLVPARRAARIGPNAALRSE